MGVHLDMRTSLLAIGLVVSSCRGMLNHSHVPASMKGDTPLVVANHHDDKICYLFIKPPGDKSEDNWLSNPIGGDIGLDPNDKRSFDVKPGHYVVEVESCSHDLRATPQQVDIKGPTFFTIGSGSATPPAGYAMVRIGGRSGESCLDSGAFNPAGGAAMCCSKSTHPDTSPNTVGTPICD
jgi:hypothetical protein